MQELLNTLARCYIATGRVEEAIEPFEKIVEAGRWAPSGANVQPWDFIVIDDPVQAMDPARVDGLARVFADLAADRQLIVFTHDDRLPESLRRLGLAHALLEVTRRPGSIVETRRAVDPVYQYFSYVTCPGFRCRCRRSPRASKAPIISSIIAGLPHRKTCVLAGLSGSPAASANLPDVNSS